MNAELKITGRLAEVGNLDGGSTPGASIYAGDGRYIEVHNLSEDEARAIAPAFGEMVTVSIALAERTTAPVSLTDAKIEELAIKHESFGFGQAGKKSKLSIHGFEPEGLREFARALLAAAPAPIQQEPVKLSEEDICAFQHALQQLEWIAAGKTPGRNCDLYDDYNKATIQHAKKHAESALKRMKPAFVRLLDLWSSQKSSGAA